MDGKPDIHNGVLTFNLPDGTSKTFEANQSNNTDVEIVPLTAAGLIGLVSGMTEEQKAALRDMLGLTSGGDEEPGGEEPSGEEPTTFNCGTSKMVDADGNQYETVQIGTQCWTKTNLRVKAGTSPDTTSFTVAHYYVNPSVDDSIYGYYYNWEAAKLACPSGWHLPSDEEWTAMQVYVSTAKDAEGNYMYRCDGDSMYIARALATDGEDYWFRGYVNELYPCEPEYNLTRNNGTGFSAVPAGDWINGFENEGLYAYFWSSSDKDTYDAWGRYLYYANEYVYGNHYSRYDGFSVRCLRDAEPGGSEEPGGEEPGGEEPTTFNCGTDKLIIGTNEYETVQIGTQCWTKTNMREPAGTQGTSSTDTSSTAPYYYVKPGVDADTNGYYYNWPAANQVCPAGWHLPSDDEWTQLTDYVSNAQVGAEYIYRCAQSNANSIGKALAFEKGWKNSSGECYVGDQSSKPNNTTGFSAVPAGYYTGSSSSLSREMAFFWSSTENSIATAYVRYLHYYNSTVYVGNQYTKYMGYSVRCLRDAEPGGGEEPGGEEPAEFNCGDNLIIGENSYPTVQIGTQCWTKTNLREAVGTNGTDLTDDNYSYTEPFYYVNPNVDAAVYGYYYNWPAANQVCPEGWHLPDTTEWNTMQVYVSTAKDAYGNYMYRCEGDSTYIAQALATDGDYWYRGDVSESYPCEPEYDLTKNNKTGFSAVPAGYCYYGFVYAGYGAFFWSSTEYGTDYAWYRGLYYNVESVGRYYGSRGFGFSVRCVRNAEPGGGGEEPGGEEPTAFTCGTSTVSDHEGNVYNTVQIGTQCWTKENMRCTTSPSTGTYIVNTTSDQSTYTGKMAKWYNNDSATYAPMNYGLLYNWNAAVDTFNTDFEETSVNTDHNNAVSALFAGNRRGICPEGWHIPSDAEWDALEEYVGNAKQGDNYLYRCEPTDPSSIAKALASTTDDWSSYSGECYPGDQTTKPNNASGFSAVPAGWYGSHFGGAGIDTYFWSATQTSSSGAHSRYLNYNNPYVSRYYGSKYGGFSVRCLRD